MNKLRYWEPAVDVDKASYEAAGKQVLQSHIHFMCGAINSPAPMKIIVFIKDMDWKAIEVIKKMGTSIELLRHDVDGTLLKRTLKCFMFDKHIFGLSPSMQAIDIKSIINPDGIDMKATWEDVELAGVTRKCLTLMNKLETITLTQ